jgi:hypothetical protein
MIPLTRGMVKFVPLQAQRNKLFETVAKMKTFFSILLVWLSFVAAIEGQTSASKTWQVQRYDLVVNLPQDEKVRQIPIQASLNLKNISGASAGVLTLRISPSAEISAVQINGASAEFSKSEEKISPTSSLQRIVIRFAPAAPNSILTVSIAYKLNIKDNTAVAALSPVSVQLLPLSFWYPTPTSWFFTQGGDSAPFRLTVNGSAGQTVVSAGKLTAGAFDQSLNGEPFFAAGKWEVSEQNGVSVYMPAGAGADAQKRAGELASLLFDAKAFVEQMLGKAPDVPLRIVSVRRGAGFGSGGVVTVDEAVFRRSKIDSQTAMSIAEAAAKLWIGNAVTVTGEGYGAISEGLTRYIATQFIENKYGKDVADIERLRQRTSYAAVAKRDSALSKASPLDDFYYPEVANKGAMIWRLVAKRLGQTEFFNTVRANMQDGNLNIAELRAALSSQKDVLDYLFDQVTDMDLQIGLPQVTATGATSALHNTGAIDVTVDVTATTETGQKLTAPATIKATNFGEITFKSNSRIARVEIDSDKLYPQTEYANDVMPSVSTDSDPLLAVKRLFDKQDFAGAESLGRKLLGDLPRSGDLRIWLARALLAQSKNADAEKEFRAVLDEKLPAARSLAWANVGLGEIASRSNQKDVALKYAEAAIIADADYGASLAARVLRNKLGGTPVGDATVKAFFSDFDKAAAAKRKADLESMVVPGEVTKFVSGAAGSAETWQTQIVQIDRLDPNTIFVEANMSIKLLGSNPTSGMAVYRLVKIGSAWKLFSVDMFEVR